MTRAAREWDAQQRQTGRPRMRDRDRVCNMTQDDRRMRYFCPICQYPAASHREGDDPVADEAGLIVASNRNPT